MNTRRLISLTLLPCAVALGVAACASSTSTTPKPKPSPSPTSAIAADQKEIAANWTAFFSAKTPVSQRVSLLQDGSQFASVIQAQATSPLALAASAKVTKVTVITSSQAQVTYNILESGTLALGNQTGEAVYQNKTWKVGVASFCALLTLEAGGSTSSLPAACKSAT